MLTINNNIMKEENTFVWIMNWHWTPVIIGTVVAFGALALDAWTGGVGLVLFGGLALWKWFFK